LPIQNTIIYLVDNFKRNGSCWNALEMHTKPLQNNWKTELYYHKKETKHTHEGSINNLCLEDYKKEIGLLNNDHNYFINPF
jgi:hypothetical protein